jgi:hypothetical protein
VHGSGLPSALVVAGNLRFASCRQSETEIQ